MYMIWSEKLKRQRIKMWNLKIQTYRPVEQNSSWRMGTCLAIWGPMACSMPGFPVLHYLPEFTQTHVHWISDAIQPFFVIPFSFCLQSFQASGAFPMSWLFASDFQNTGVSALVSVLPMNIQGWFPLGLIDLISLLFKGLSKVLSNTTVGRHQFFSAKLSFWSRFHICTWLLEKP